MSDRNRQFYKIFDGVAATKNSGLDAVSGKAYGIDIKDFRNCIINIGGSGTAGATIKIKGGIADNAQDIDFASAASRTNPFSTIQIVNLEDGVPVDGDTGIVFPTLGDGSYLFEANINAVDYIQFEITAYSAGAINLSMTVTGNN